MKKDHLLIAVAFLVHLAAWFLPVAREGVRFPDSLPGAQAFVIAVEGIQGPPWYEGVLSGLSALSTILFLLGAGWVVAKGSPRVRNISAWIAACAFVVNAHWIRDSGRIGLRIGYYLWWISFLLLALGLLWPSRATNREI
jgi:hypothetical protein